MLRRWTGYRQATGQLKLPAVFQVFRSQREHHPVIDLVAEGYLSLLDPLPGSAYLLRHTQAGIVGGGSSDLNAGQPQLVESETRHEQRRCGGNPFSGVFAPDPVAEVGEACPAPDLVQAATADETAVLRVYYGEIVLFAFSPCPGT